MAKVTGPLMSIAASGTFAKTLVFSVWKGRPYVRERVIPDNPQSAMQTGQRAMMGFLSKAWDAIKIASSSSWAAIAAAKAISSFNAFVGTNLDSWQEFIPPTQTYPAAGASTELTVTTQTCTGGVGLATIEVTPSGATSIWGIALFRDTAAITVPSWANCIAVLRANGANKLTHVDSPLEPATYHYRSAVFNADGVIGTIHADGTATVT